VREFGGTYVGWKREPPEEESTKRWAPRTSGKGAKKGAEAAHRRRRKHRIAMQCVTVHCIALRPSKGEQSGGREGGGVYHASP